VTSFSSAVTSGLAARRIEALFDDEVPNLSLIYLIELNLIFVS
jgi:hypothetical protein